MQMPTSMEGPQHAKNGANVRMCKVCQSTVTQHRTWARDHDGLILHNSYATVCRTAVPSLDIADSSDPILLDLTSDHWDGIQASPPFDHPFNYIVHTLCPEFEKEQHFSSG